MLQRAVLADFALDAVFLLADPATFNSAAYTGVLNELMHGQGTATVSSVQPDIITGGQARGLYFPNVTSVYLFQLVHITRVQASVATAADAQMTALLTSSLPSACLSAGVGIMGIDPAPSAPAVNWLLNLPPLVAPIAVGVWLLTVVSCAVCWLVFCACRKKKKRPVAPPFVAPAPSAPEAPMTMSSEMEAIMRQPFERVRCAGQSDPYETPQTWSGPAAVRLASWPGGPALRPP